MGCDGSGLRVEKVLCGVQNGAKKCDRPYIVFIVNMTNTICRKRAFNSSAAEGVGVSFNCGVLCI
jgi:hypothetical protein